MSENLVVAQLEADGQVLHLLLNHAPANILSEAMLAAIDQAISDALSPKLKAIVFEGAGKHFSFGASVEEHVAARVPAMFRAFHGLFHRLAELAIPTCAILRGQCLGGGLELASYCTWVVASPEAKLGQPEITLGVFPPMASILLPWRVGGGVAMDLCVSGRSVGADEALRLGLVTAVADQPKDWWDQFFERKIAPKSASSLRFGERAVRQDLLRQMGEPLARLERLYIDELMATADANEGIAAFMERRPARFGQSE